MKKLLSKGLGTKVRQVDQIIPENEKKFWTIVKYSGSTLFKHEGTQIIGLRTFDEHQI